MPDDFDLPDVASGFLWGTPGFEEKRERKWTSDQDNEEDDRKPATKWDFKQNDVDDRGRPFPRAVREAIKAWQVEEIVRVKITEEFEDGETIERIHEVLQSDAHAYMQRYRPHKKVRRLHAQIMP
jgi:hypothetical protein